MNFRALSICAAAFLFTNSVPDISAAQQFMTQEQLLLAIPGSTLQGKDKKGVPWAQAYASSNGGKKKKGKITGNYDGTIFESKWYVEGDRWCEDWGSGSECWNVEQLDPDTFQMWKLNGTKHNKPWRKQK